MRNIFSIFHTTTVININLCVHITATSKKVTLCNTVYMYFMLFCVCVTQVISTSSRACPRDKSWRRHCSAITHPLSQVPGCASEQQQQQQQQLISAAAHRQLTVKRDHFALEFQTISRWNRIKCFARYNKVDNRCSNYTSAQLNSREAHLSS